VTPADVAAVKSVLTAIWPAVAAAIGAWLGARFAFTRYKSERSFDRRILWHEQMHRVLAKCKWHMQCAAMFDYTRNTAAADVEYKAALGLADEIAAIQADAALYADQAAIDALEAFTQVANRSTFRPLSVGQGADAAAFDARMASALTNAHAAATAANAIALEVRTALGLKAFRYPEWKPIPENALAQRSGDLGAPGHTPDTPAK
jgi:hypothetical protein